jgi:endoglucanase
MVAIAVAVALAVWSLIGPAPTNAAAVRLTPQATVDAFFGRYVLANGRVERADDGGDTVSEGQAYALLMSAAVGNRRDFMSVWTWTEQHLLLPDGLLAWHWAGGRVVGSQPATDADLGAAAALLTAAPRFGDPNLLAAGRRLASAVLAHEVGPSHEGPTLVAGPWALTSTEYVDPSYLAPAEIGEVASVIGGRWWSIASTADTQLQLLTANGNLPADWAVIGSDHRIHPAAAPGTPAGRPARFGFDAVRAPIWMAVSCSAPLRAAAAGLRPALGRGHDEVELNLGGHPSPGVKSPLGFLAVAGADWAAGDQGAAWTELEQAARADHAHPTYYAAAWVALTTLGFDHQLGHSC